VGATKARSESTIFTSSCLSWKKIASKTGNLENDTFYLFAILLPLYHYIYIVGGNLFIRGWFV